MTYIKTFWGCGGSLLVGLCFNFLFWICSSAAGNSLYWIFVTTLVVRHMQSQGLSFWVVQSQISIPLQFLCTLCYKLVHSAHCSLTLLEAINDYFFLHSSPFSPDDDLAFFRRRAHFPQARSSYAAYTEQTAEFSVFMGGANKNLLLSYYMLNLFACKHKQLAGAQKNLLFPRWR